MRKQVKLSNTTNYLQIQLLVPKLAVKSKILRCDVIIVSINTIIAVLDKKINKNIFQFGNIFWK